MHFFSVQFQSSLLILLQFFRFSDKTNWKHHFVDFFLYPQKLEFRKLK